MNIEELDFRHLQLLATLLKTRSVSEAARLLDIPQPSASHGLKRLRAALDDQLLVRVRRGMELTPRALEISETVGAILKLKNDLERQRDSFDAGQLDRTFLLAASDLGQSVFLKAIYRSINHSAPHVKIRALLLSKEEMFQALEDGSLDLAIGPFPKLVAGLKQQRLFSETYCCYAHPTHPFAKSKKLRDYLAAEHILVSTKGMSHAHRKLENSLREHLDDASIRIITSSFLVGIATAANTDLIVTLPGAELEELAELYGLARIDPPIKLEGFDVKQYWHNRNDDDSAHKWLRNTVFDAMSGRRDR